MSASASTPLRRAAPLSAAVQIALVAALLAVAAGCWVLTGDRMDGMDAGPGHRARRPGLVPGQLGGDDGRDDAAGHGADGRRARRAIRPAARGRATLAFVAGYLLVWSAVGLVAYALVEGVRSLDLGFLAWDQARALRRGRRHPRRRAVPAHTGQGRVPAPLPRPTRGAQRARARRPLRRLLLGADGGALRAGRDEHRLDGLRGRAHRRRAPAAVAAHGQAAIAVVLAVLGLAVAFAPGQVPGLTLPDSQDAAGMTMMQQ